MLVRDLTKDHVGKDLYINDQGKVSMGRLRAILPDQFGVKNLVIETVEDGRVKGGPLFVGASVYATVKVLEITRQDVNEKIDAALHPKTAIEWLMGNNDYLEGARPWDLLNMGRYEEVLQALELCFQ